MAVGAGVISLFLQRQPEEFTDPMGTHGSVPSTAPPGPEYIVRSSTSSRPSSRARPRIPART